MMNSIAIVGSSGYISSFLLKEFRECPDKYKIVKIDQIGDFDYYLDLNKPENFDYDVLCNVDFAIFTAAVSGPDKCANEYDECWKINVSGTEYFINEAVKRNCKVLFFSSDAVYGEDKGNIFNELSKTNATTAYGKMKKHVEDSFLNNTLFKAIRLSYVASRKDRFTNYCFSCIKKEETAEVFHPFYRNAIVVSDVVRTVKWLLENWGSFNCQFLNISGRELVSRVRMADEINRICGGKLYYKVTLPESKFFENRPRITQMESLFLFKNDIVEDMSFSKKYRKELEEVENE